MLRSGRWTVTIALAVSAIAALALAAPAPAVVPPKDCGKMAVDGKHYRIKADQLRCETARKYAKRYLKKHDRPRGYDCESYGGGTRIEFRCQNGIKVIFAIRR
jgi:hypothetical protein